MCDEPICGPAYLVRGARKHPGQRRWTGGQFLICGNCLACGYDVDRRVWLGIGTERDRFRWHAIVGRGELMPPAPCAACGCEVIRNSDPLLKRVTCSAACSVSLTRTRNGNKGSGKPCETCGKPITAGRADSLTCSPACRQKAYRRRQAAQGERQAPAAAPRPMDGRRRSQSKSIANGVAHLSGFAMGMEGVGRIDASVSLDQAAAMHADLSQGIAVLEGFQGKLNAWLEQHPHA